MAWLLSFLYRWLGRHSAEATRHEEFAAYLDADVEARIRAGASPTDARREALIAFGGVTQVHERTREARFGAGFDGLRQDLRYAVRSLIHVPGFTAAVCGSLAIGLAAVIAASALVTAVVVRPLPGVVRPSQLVDLRPYRACGANAPDCWNLISSGRAEYDVMLGAPLTAFEEVAGTTLGTVNAALPDAASLDATFVSPRYFDLLGVALPLGRPFPAADNPAADTNVCVISHRLWTRAFDAQPSVLGRTIQIAGLQVVIVGVAPAGFRGLNSGSDIWLPIALADRVANAFTMTVSAIPPGERYIRYVGRLKAGVNPHQARAEADILAPRLQSLRGTSSPPVWIDVMPATRIDLGRALLAIGLIVPVPILVLAIGCINAANLLLARASLRGREIAVRLAIGASRARVVRQLLVESGVLAGASIALALPLAWAVTEAAAAYLDQPIPLDGGAAVSGVLAATASAVAFGLAPALRITKAGPARALAHLRIAGGPGRSRLRQGLVGAQIALSMALLAVCLQLVHALAAENVVAGTPPDRLVLMSIDLGQPNVTPDAVRTFYQQLLDRAGVAPHVAATGLAPRRVLWALGRGHQSDNSVSVWGPADGPRNGHMYFGGYTGGRFFDAVGLRLLEGRTFDSADQARLRPLVAVVNDALGRKLFDGHALGQRLRVAGPRAEYAASEEVTVIGVVESIDDPGFTRDGGASPAIYLPVPLSEAKALTLYVRATAPLGSVAPALRAIVRDLDATVPIVQLATLDGLNEEAGRRQLFLARAGTLLGLAALLLATIGLYALASFLVTTRAREIAIRIAMGAAPGGVMRLVLRQSMGLAAGGGAIGVIVAVAASQIIRSEMHGAALIDLTALGLSALLLAAAMLIASAVPAARAGRVDPISLLKEE